MQKNAWFMVLSHIEVQVLLSSFFVYISLALIVVGFFKWAATHIEREREIHTHIHREREREIRT